MWRPSGDQLGTPVNAAPSQVSWLQFPPSLSHTQISRLPPRSDSKATLFPSGEYCWANSFLVEAISLSGRPGFPSASGSCNRQMSLSPPTGCENTRRADCLETDGQIAPSVTSTFTGALLEGPAGASVESLHIDDSNA